jgi:hypothetical protein
VTIARELIAPRPMFNAVLDNHAAEVRSDRALRRALALELERLNEYVSGFHGCTKRCRLPAKPKWQQG